MRDKLLAHARRKGRDRSSPIRSSLVSGASAERLDRRAHEGDEPLEADAVVLATGGLSVPNTGSDGRGLADRRRRSDMRCNPTYAALTPLQSG